MARVYLRILLIALIAVSAARADSDSEVFEGSVFCAETGRLIKNAKVWFFDVNDIVLTNSKGRFSLQPPQSLPARLVVEHPGFVVSEAQVTQGQTALRVALQPREMSAASHRMRYYIESEKAYNKLVFLNDTQWQFEFMEVDLGGDFASDPALVRRDPSAIIRVDSTYYVYYSRGTRYAHAPEAKAYPWDLCDIWYATSPDGFHWTEQGPAVTRGTAGAFDSRSVFTPEVLAHQGKYYLVYQAVAPPYNARTRNVVGMAVANSPKGPWEKLAHPILQTTPNGIWADDSERRIAAQPGDFDSLKVHDPCLLFYNEKFYLYYKGQRVGEHRFYGKREIQWGVAIADSPTGPYEKSVFNPITTTGHEVCVWPHNGGVALLHFIDGPEAKTSQWAPDGINFEIMSRIPSLPESPGLYRGDGNLPQDGVRWGLSHAHGTGDWHTTWNYIRRFDLVETD